ncbi:hypothetical protein BJ508DRAFT_416333 [Ascobolus immersus RN42]|uniref:Uncharacterized protein n=1 Tax=Ascobolus immersus RN42 TaxID=1160509 RepID=A0A3N4I090_ASCIM|nr:hypothetical protein BJ508DRAFT_416333 [Ascobolus immersus RN42]
MENHFLEPPVSNTASSSIAAYPSTPPSQSATTPEQQVPIAGPHGCPPGFMTDKEFEQYFTAAERAKMKAAFAAKREHHLRQRQLELDAQKGMNVKRARSLFKGRTKSTSIVMDAAVDFIANKLGEYGVLQYCRFRSSMRSRRKGVWELVVDVGAIEVVRKALDGTDMQWISSLMEEVDRPVVFPDAIRLHGPEG